jgi:microcin C transport system substrate-binding protein
MFNFDEVGYRYYQDETARLEAFKAGEFDVSAENMAKQWARGYIGPKFDDGRIVKKTLPHQRSAGMQGFVFNLRRPQFADKRLRQAISLAFDFEWANRNLFYGQYRRSNSFFTNSELAASGLPGPDELKLLEPIREKLDPAVFGLPVEPPFTDGRYGIRRNLRRRVSCCSRLAGATRAASWWITWAAPCVSSCSPIPRYTTGWPAAGSRIWPSWALP